MICLFYLWCLHVKYGWFTLKLNPCNYCNLILHKTIQILISHRWHDIDFILIITIHWQVSSCVALNLSPKLIRMMPLLFITMQHKTLKEWNSHVFTTTYCAFLRRAKQKTGRVCEAKTTCHICDAPRIAPCGSPTIANL